MFWGLKHWLKHGNRLGIFCLAVAVALFVGGGVSLARGLTAQRQVAETQNRGDIPKPGVQPKPGLYMDRSLPATVRIPAIGVSSSLITVGKEADGSIGSPKPGPDFDKAAWYRDSPAPGQYGAAVIVGHVDSYANGNGASVFYNLSKLRPGNLVYVDRADRSVAKFKVYATRQYPRNKLPHQQVYLANSPDAELRLITCAGQFDKKTDEYDSNAVIFASLVK